jgi:hypothetical protein
MTDGDGDAIRAGRVRDQVQPTVYSVRETRHTFPAGNDFPRLPIEHALTEPVALRPPTLKTSRQFPLAEMHLPELGHNYRLER